MFPWLKMENVWLSKKMDWSVVTTKPWGWYKSAPLVCILKWVRKEGDAGAKGEDFKVMRQRWWTLTLANACHPFQAHSWTFWCRLWQSASMEKKREEPSHPRNRKPSSLCGPARVTLLPNLTWFEEADARLVLFSQSCVVVKMVKY